MALPKNQRTPHTLDKNGFARPMTEREIAIAEGRIIRDASGKEVEIELSPPWEEHPAYKKHKAFFDRQKRKLEEDTEPSEEEEEEGSEAEYDKLLREEEKPSKEEIALAKEEDIEAEKVKRDIQEMMKDAPPMPRAVLNILNFDADQAIEEMTVDQYLDQYKDYAPINESLVENTGDMYRYQQTYIDEKDLAEHDFRKDQSGSKSLEDFIKT